MSSDRLRLGTRGSELALWQARSIVEALRPEREVEIVPITTTGDRVTDRPPEQVGEPSLWTKEIERALLDGEIDLAVHSAKDTALAMPEGIVVAAIPERGPAGEILIVHPDAHDEAQAFVPLALEASCGTSAPRRTELLRAMRPDVRVVPIRGNVPTRVDKVRQRKVGAALLALAGVTRLDLDLSGLVAIELPPDVFVPAPAQGALLVQARAGDEALLALCRRRLHDPATAREIDAERGVLAAAGGGCHLPLGALVRGDGPYTAHVFFRAERDAPGRWASATHADPAIAGEQAYAACVGEAPTGVGPLDGMRVSLVGSAGPGSELATRMSALGARVGHERVLEFEDVSAADLPARIARLRAGDALAVTSREAARRLKGLRVPKGVFVGAVGPATARALSAAGIAVHATGRGGGRALAEVLRIGADGKVLFPCADDALSDLEAALAEREIPSERIVLYRTRAHGEAPAAPEQEPDVRVYLSASAVTAAVELGVAERKGVRRVAMGRTAREALAEAGLDSIQPPRGGPMGVVDVVARLAARRRAARSSPEESAA